MVAEVRENADAKEAEDAWEDEGEKAADDVMVQRCERAGRDQSA